MSTKSAVSLDPGYGPKTPDSIMAENARLKALLTKHCRGPYDARGIRINLGLNVEGETGSPNPLSGIKTGPFTNDTVFSEINVGRSDWRVPLDAYRHFVWLNVEKAIQSCLLNLGKRGVSFDADRVRHDLALVKDEFFGENAQSAEPIPHRKWEEVTIDVYAEDPEQRIVIQYKRDDQNAPWDFERKVAFENLLNECLNPGNLGCCDSVDFDFASINAICLVSSARKATEVILEKLRENGLLDGAVIEETVEGKRTIVWPKGFIEGIDYI